jgi:hypothetical protein
LDTGAVCKGSHQTITDRMRTIFLGLSTLLLAFTLAMLTFLSLKRWEMRRNAAHPVPVHRSHADFRPSPRLSAEQVTDIQLAALKHNDVWDQGIRKAFEFFDPSAGPEKRLSFEEFRRMLRSDSYKSILNYRRVKKNPVNYYENKAFRVVTVAGRDGRYTSYLFELEFQDSGDFEKCWLTKNVRKLDERSPYAQI